MIRQASLDDLDEVVDLLRAFHAYSPYREFPFDPEAQREFAGRLIEGGVILLSEDGLIGGLINPLYFNPAIKAAAELFWWAPKGGTELRLAFEEWAKEQGAQLAQFSGLVDERERASRLLYRRAGYRPVETGYIKRL